MRGLLAALYKELKLFLRGGGLIGLLAPLLLLPALRAGMGDLSRHSQVQPFPIGVRDLDGTLMSRSLISQMAQLELFSELYILGGEEPDQAALDRGAAAAVTVPKDFFYKLYRMEDCPVEVTLNRDMPLEASLFQAIFTSVMDIIRADQTAGLGLYTFCYGALTPELEGQLYAQASEQLLLDALGRQAVFGTAARRSDLQGALERRLLACVLAAAVLLFPLSAVKTLPEERTLGVLPRLRGTGCPLSAFLLAKLLAAALLSLPTLLLLLLVLRPDRPWAVAALFLLLLAGAFGLLLGLAAWTRSGAQVQRLGSVLLLVSLVLGGVLWPRHLLPGVLPALGRLTLPYYASLGLEGIHAGLSLPELLALLWPVPALGLAGLALVPPGLRRHSGGNGHVPHLSRGASPPRPPALAGVPARLLGISAIKLRAVAGGYRGLLLLLTAALLCGTAASSALRGGASALALTVLDGDRSPLSQELVHLLEDREGVRLTVLSSEREARRQVLLGETEGVLYIGAGYGEALAAGDELPLSYQGAPAALSAQGVRELAAGQVAVQRSRLRALTQAPDLLGRPLSREEEPLLLAAIHRVWADMPPLYHLHTARGAAPVSPFVPSPMGFAALAVLFTLFTASAWCGAPDGRAAETRMSGLPYGRLLARGSDLLALTALGGLTALAALLPCGRTVLAEGLPASLCFAFCAAALSLTLTRLTAREGRIDCLAPFLALILCLLGGCFLDLSQFSPVLAAAALVTPPGLALAAARGSAAALAALLGEGALFLLPGLVSGRRRR